MMHRDFPLSANVRFTGDRSHQAPRPKDTPSHSGDGRTQKIAHFSVWSGRAVSAGLADGRVHRHTLVVSPAHNEGPSTCENELTRLRSAMAEMQHRMDLIVAAGVSAGFDGRDSVLEAYRVFTRSQNWMDRLEAGIRSGRSAEAAVMEVQQETRARFERINDLCLRDWLSDLDLIANDLVRGLLATEDWQDADLGPDAVVVADDLSAGEVLRLGQLATAFVLEKSSDTAPAAIIAASLGIPMVVQVDGSAAARDGDHIFVDGDDGTVVVRRKVRLVHVNGDGSLDGQEVQVRSSHLSDNQHGRQASPLWDHGTFRGWLEEVLGPVPDQSLRAMIGYGLSDREIARYYGLDEATIAVVRRIYEMG